MSPTEADKQMYIFTHWFDFLHLGKRIQEWGHEFEDVMEAYDNWKNCDKSMPQLMGEIQAMRFKVKTGENFCGQKYK